MKNFKKFTAIALAATMTIGSTMTVFAEDGVSEGEGSYEGGEMKYPTLSVTLPTIPDGTYNYIADPNGLIAATNNEKYTDATFTGTTGIFFLTDSTNKSYTENSAAQELSNENAQDIDVSVKLEQMTAGDSSIKYASSATFEAEDKENKLYLAITDGATTDPIEAALSDGGAAVVKTTVAGVPGNFEAGYDSTNGYGYTKKDEADLSPWNKCSFKMTGALNQNATWGDDLTFPAIKVTWSFAEHQDYTEETAHGSWSGGSLWLAVDAKTGFSSSNLKVEVSDGGTNYVELASGKYNVNSTNWVSTTWANITEALGGEPSGKAFIRITDGATRYTFENK